MIKIVVLLGTRPEIIRLSRILNMLDGIVDLSLIHTGQNYDYELNQIFFEDLNIRKPDYFLGIKTDTVGTSYGQILIKSEEALLKIKPDGILILGDTNSSLAALIAKRLKITIYHMEAGNRSFDQNVPEEINRKIIDHISDINLPYTEHARRNLLNEGIHPRSIYLTGSPMNEVLSYYKNEIENSKILNKTNLKEKEYILVSTHREEIVDNIKNLSLLFDILKEIQVIFNKKIIISTHPRTKKRLAEYKMNFDDSFMFLKPFGFFDYINLQKNAFCTLSDSGSVSEEASILGFPAITFRTSIERPEAMDVGGVFVTGINPENIITILKHLDKFNYNSTPQEYEITNVSERVTKLILGTYKLSKEWSNIKIKPN